MSLRTLIGPRRSMLEETPEHARLLELESPVLLSEELAKLKTANADSLVARTLDTTFPVAEGIGGLERGVDALCSGCRRGGPAGRHHPDPLGPGGRPGPRADPVADGGRGGPPPPDRARHPDAL